MKIGALTSSRADYGIYRPLLEKLATNNRFDLHIIAFGMHVLAIHGKTVNEIDKDNFGTLHQVEGMPTDDSRLAIAKGYGNIVKSFATFWSQNDFDYVLTLGDRWEMSAAVQASIPFEVKLAHIHGGEATLGATDNIYRHQISLAASLHFTAATEFSNRIKELTGEGENIHTVGSISLERLETMKLPAWSEVAQKFDIPFKRFILTTIHPESVNAVKNAYYADLIEEVISKSSVEHNFLITKANADVMGTIYNEKLEALAAKHPKRIKVVSSLGKLNYFSAMKCSDFLVGNTSSGIIEAASFQKWVINLGDRQKGRLRSGNVLDVPFDKDAINAAIKKVETLGVYEGANKYVQANSADKVIEILLTHARL